MKPNIFRYQLTVFNQHKIGFVFKIFLALNCRVNKIVKTFKIDNQILAINTMNTKFNKMTKTH